MLPTRGTSRRRVSPYRPTARAPALFPAADMLLPGRGTVTNKITEIGRRRECWGGHILRVMPLLVADRKPGYQRGVNLIELRRLGRVRTRYRGGRWQDTAQRIVCSRRGQGGYIAK